MGTKRICSTCGRELSTDAPQGLCPECLIKAGFETGATPQPGQPSHDAQFTPPSVAELRHLFPQLDILELVAQGGMGAVYRARQPALERSVALKILPAQATQKPGFTERFNREARALARLNHPNIIAVHEFGAAEGMPYFVMEYVEGVTLRRLVQQHRLGPREALQIVSQICDALQFAHDEGVVHRDIKPENILIDKKGRVKIADFGIAKIVGGDHPSQSLTREQVLGTPHYMAPEQIEHPQAVDHRADIYSLGVVFYEMLTGELPLGKFAPPSRKVQIDVRLDEVVLHALEKEPERRYQQASEVKTDVQTIASSQAGLPGSSPACAANSPRLHSESAARNNLRPGGGAEPVLPAWASVARWSARVLGTIFLGAFLVMMLVWGMQPIPSLGPHERVASAAWALTLLGFVLGWRFEGTAALLIAFGWALFPFTKGVQPQPILSPLPLYLLVAALYAAYWWAAHAWARGRRAWTLAATATAVLAVLGFSFLLATPRLHTAPVGPHGEDNSSASRSIRWQQDLDFFASELPARQKDFARLVSRSAFETQVGELRQQIPRLSHGEIVLALQRLAATLNVAHTRVDWPPAFRTYPLAFFWYSDGLGVFAATPQYRDAIGCRVTKIGSMTPEQLEAAVAPYISHENESWLHSQSPGLMRTAELVQHLGTVQADGRLLLSLTRPDGKPITLDIAPTGPGEPVRFILPWEVLPMAVPLCHKRAADPYWYEFLPEARALYIHYRACRNAPNLPFADFVKDVFAFADSNSVRQVIVDLRNNGGGDSEVIRPLINGLKVRRAWGAEWRVSALTGRGTFSSGLLAAIALRNEAQAILVGEPTGGKPNSYGNTTSFSLPNSHIQVWCCDQFFRALPESDPPSLEPDIAVGLSLPEFLAGRDPALEAALNQWRCNVVIGDEGLNLNERSDAQFEANVLLLNHGAAPTPSFAVDFYVRSAQRGTRLLAHQAAGPIAPAGSWREGTFPFSLSPDDTEVFVLIDPENTLQRQTADKLQASRTVTRPASIAGDSPSLEPGAPVGSGVSVSGAGLTVVTLPQGPFQAVASFLNRASAHSAPFTVRFYLGDTRSATRLISINTVGPIQPNTTWNEGSLAFTLKKGEDRVIAIIDPENALKRQGGKKELHLTVAVNAPTQNWGQD